MKKSSTLMISSIALAALLAFSGCAKKDVVSGNGHGSSSSGAYGTNGTHGVNGLGGANGTHGVNGLGGASGSASVKPAASAVYFAFDSYEIDASSATTLRGYALWLSADYARQANIEGHCDQRGSREYNLALGQQRAEAVKNFLVAEGVNTDNISTVSYGEERPVCSGSGEACWAQNRRAAIATH